MHGNGDRLRGVPQPDRRKVDRPPYEQLLEDLQVDELLSPSAASTASLTTPSANGSAGTSGLTDRTRRGGCLSSARPEPKIAYDPVVTAPVVVILAAGQGTRMRSAVQKLLHPLCGRPIIAWPIAAAREAGAAKVVVVDSPERRLEAASAISTGDVVVAVQERPLGTADAVKAATSQIGADDTVVVHQRRRAADHGRDDPGAGRRARAHRRGGDDRDDGAR